MQSANAANARGCSRQRAASARSSELSVGRAVVESDVEQIVLGGRGLARGASIELHEVRLLIQMPVFVHLAIESIAPPLDDTAVRTLA